MKVNQELEINEVTHCKILFLINETKNCTKSEGQLNTNYTGLYV